MSFLNKWKPGTGVSEPSFGVAPCEFAHGQPGKPLGSRNLTRAQGGLANGSKDVQKKKEEPLPEVTPLERMLQNAGPLRKDGSDKFFGLENVSSPSSLVPSLAVHIY